MLSEIGVALGLSTIRKITDLWRGAKADSLIDYTQVGRVEPIVLIDADALYFDSLGEVQQSLLSIFAGYYLQAIALSTTVGKVDVMRHLDKLNPRRNPVDSAADSMGWLLATESYKDALPMYGVANIALEAEKDSGSYKEKLDHAKFDFDASNVYAKRKMDEEQLRQRAEETQRNYEFNKEKFGHEKAMSMAKSELEKQGLAINQQKLKDSYSASEMSIGRDTLSTIKELSNLSVGKMLSVSITDGLHKAEIPIAIRLMASSLPSASLIHILSHASKDNSFKERYHAWKSGRIAFIRDLCLCQDLIDTHRKNLMADKDGIYTNLIKRQRGNQLSTLVSGNPSVATASNLVIMTTDTVAQLELRLDGKMSDFHIREKVFKDTYIMIMAVIDKQWDRVTFYHRGISAPTQVGIRDLKSSNKSSGPDVSEILRAYQLGNAPSL
jgi:hypothetical protein